MCRGGGYCPGSRHPSFRGTEFRCAWSFPHSRLGALRVWPSFWFLLVGVTLGRVARRHITCAVGTCVKFALTGFIWSEKERNRKDCISYKRKDACAEKATSFPTNLCFCFSGQFPTIVWSFSGHFLDISRTCSDQFPIIFR